jgi:hypothetical protein
MNAFVYTTCGKFSNLLAKRNVPSLQFGVTFANFQGFPTPVTIEVTVFPSWIMEVGKVF